MIFIHIHWRKSSIYHDISFYIHDSQLMANCQCVVFIKSKEVRREEKKKNTTYNTIQYNIIYIQLNWRMLCYSQALTHRRICFRFPFFFVPPDFWVHLGLHVYLNAMLWCVSARTVVYVRCVFDTKWAFCMTMNHDTIQRLLRSYFVVCNQLQIEPSIRKNRRIF